MQRYVIRRLVLFVPTLLLVSLIIFTVLRIVPGDVAAVILSGPEGERHYTQEELEQVRSQLGLNDPIYVQYGRWIWQFLSVDLGSSLFKNVSVSEELASRLPVTFELALISLLISLVVAVPLGIIMGMRQDTWTDYVLRVVSIGGLTFPPFWTGSLIILGLVLVFRWMPPVTWVNLWEDPWGNLQLLIFPALALGYFHAAVISRMVRSTMLEVLRQDYIRTARAKGLREWVVLMRHALRNALLPVVTIASLQLGSLLSGSVVMEWLYTLPGMGSGLIDSLQNRDYPIVQAFIVLIAVFLLAINLAVDIVYSWLDPRIRYE
ncbi:MAG: ABC transporter permease [Chloroflexi bacterium]|nr:ABC transporter permease [Chloroflexota bacterium]